MNGYLRGEIQIIAGNVNNMNDLINLLQGRRSLWDMGTCPPQYL